MLIGHLKNLSMSVCLQKLAGRLVLHKSFFPNVFLFGVPGRICVNMSIFLCQN